MVMQNKPNLQEIISLIETKLEDKSRIIHWIHTGNLIDILTLLKEQEMIEPITDNEDGYWCGSCHEDIVWHQKYCSNCGHAIKWN